MGTIVSVQKDFDADETDWDFGETMAHSGYLYPMENQRILTSKQISIPYSSDDQKDSRTLTPHRPTTYKAMKRSSRQGPRTSGGTAESQGVRTVNVAPAYASDRDDVDMSATEEEMDTLALQSPMLSLSCESVEPSPESCAESGGAPIIANSKPVKLTKDGAPNKQHKPRLNTAGFGTSPAPPLAMEASRKRNISGERATVTEKQTSKPTERHAPAPEQNAVHLSSNTLLLDVGTNPAAGLTSPRRTYSPNPAKERMTSASVTTSLVLKHSKKLPPIKIPLRPSLMSIGSGDLAIVLTPRSPQPKSPQPHPQTHTQRPVHVVITNEQEGSDATVPVPQPCARDSSTPNGGDIPKDGSACNMEQDKYTSALLPGGITKLLFEEISDGGYLDPSSIMEDSFTKDSGIEEGAEEEEVKVESDIEPMQGNVMGVELKASREEPFKDSRSGSIFVPPDEKYIRKAAKLRGEGTIGKLKNLTPSVRRDYDDFMVDIENVAFYAKQQAEATLGDYTPQKVLLISSRVPNCDSLKAAVRPDVLCQIYDFENETLKGIVEIVKNLLNAYKEGAKAKYLGIVCKGGPGYMYMLTKTPVTPAKLKQNGDMIMFWKCIGVLMSKLVPRGSFIHLMESNVAGNVQGEKLLQDMETILSSSQVCVQAPLEMSPRGREMIALYFDPVMHRQWKSTRYPKLQLYIK